jgi:hypothetical protein
VIEARFSRAAFDSAPDAEALSRELAAILVARLNASNTPGKEVARIIADLRALDHGLWSWDESDDGATWGGDYVKKPYPKQMMLRLYYPPSQPAEVDVMYGPRAPEKVPIPCPQCQAPMHSTHVLVRVTGHGVTDGPTLDVLMHVGDWPSTTDMAGPTTFQKQWNGLSCSKCLGIWLPGPKVGP